MTRPWRSTTGNTRCRGSAGSSRRAASRLSANLLIPAPIKRSYVFDLDAGCSVVNHCMRHGLAPFLTVVAPHSRAVPPSAVLPVHTSFTATGNQVLEYDGDTGVVVQHLGVLVGRNAHRTLWPQILAWLDSATASAAVERRR